jgi:polyphosphate kinase
MPSDVAPRKQRASRRSAPRAADRLLNRELSSLDFTARVLALAADPGVPLLERVRFCAIASQQLDDFFQVRVAGLLDQVASGLAVRSADGRRPQTVLAEIRSHVLGLAAHQAKTWTRELRPALATEEVVVGTVDDCTKDELAELATRFERELYPVLTPLAVGPGQPFPYISGLSLSLLLLVRDPDTAEERLARVKVPEGLPRFWEIGSRGLFLPLEDVIAFFLPQLFPQMEIAERATFRVTRDADFEVSDEADDLLEAVELELRRRRFGDVVRVEVSEGISAPLLERLKRGLRVSDDQIYLVPPPLDLSELTELVGLDRPELKYEPWSPVVNTRFADLAEPDDVFAEIRRGDILVHHPYESFGQSFEIFLRAASGDPAAIGVKTTVYRTSDESPLVPALIEAAEDGKQSVCLVELKARFDERRNIEWSRALEHAGVHVVYGFPDMKIHAKATLVVRREGDSLQRYVHLGTGNYHAVTARHYEDFGLFTADQQIAADVADLFNYVTGFGRPQRFRKLLVAPFTLRDGLIEHIRACAEAAASGKRAQIRFKLNALTDPAIIEELYSASQAGVKIDVFARSICSLRPGVKGLSDTIDVRSIVGRFLEHSRVYSFVIDGRAQWLMGSADLMPRNLDHRLEIVTPVDDTRAQQRLAAVFETLLEDNTAWRLGADGGWTKLTPKKGERPLNAQQALMRSARRRRPASHRLARKR